MKKKIALIGLGNLAPKLFPSLNQNSCVEVIAVCDRNEQAIGRQLFKGIPFYKNYHDVKGCNPDFVYIATPPGTHFCIADYFLEKGIAVLCEKPPTGTWEEYVALKEKSLRKKVFFNIVYHFRYSREILWLKEHLHEFGKLTFASARYDDPYCENNEIISGRERLMGAWMDSASNIFGAWSFLFPELVPKLTETTMERDRVYYLPIRVNSSFLWNETPLFISISWKNNTRNKEMIFVFEKDIVYIDLPNQEIYVNGAKVLKNNDEQSTSVHYFNFFENFDRFYRDQQRDEVTKLLYSIS